MCILLSALVRLHNCLSYAALHLQNCIPCMQFKMIFFKFKQSVWNTCSVLKFSISGINATFYAEWLHNELGNWNFFFILSLQQILATLNSSVFMCSLSINSCINFFLYGELHPHDLWLWPMSVVVAKHTTNSPGYDGCWWRLYFFRTK